MVTQTHIGIDSIVEDVSGWSSPYTISTTCAPLIGELIATDHTVGPGTILTEQEVYDQVTAVEYLAWLLAERNERKSLEIRINEDGTLPPMATDKLRLVALIEVGEFMGAITTENERLCAFATDQIENAAAMAAAVELSLPSLKIVKEQFADRVSSAGAAHYIDCLTKLWPLQLVDRSFDATEVAVIVAASESGFLADLGDWARGIDLGTEADISRAKRELSNQGIISVTKEPMGVGRPRHRLELVPEQFERTNRTDLELVGSILFE